MEFTRRQFLRASLVAAAGTALLGFNPLKAKASVPLEGLAYGPFRDGQSPHWGIYPTISQIEEDLSILTELTNSVRTYGVEATLKHIPYLCGVYGLRCYAGAWLSWDEIANQQNIDDIIDVGNQGYHTLDALIVGNEVLLRDDMSESKLISYIDTVKQNTSMPVTTSEDWYRWMVNPNLVDAVDYVMVNIHPYWEGIPVQDAVQFVFDIYDMVADKYPGKIVEIGETGWPTAGATVTEAVPSEVNQERFFNEFLEIADMRGINSFFFEAFDEKWKRVDEGEVGAHWGLMYSDRYPKPAIEPYYPWPSLPPYHKKSHTDSSAGCFISSISKGIEKTK